MPELPGADEPHQVPSGYFKVVTVGDRHTAYYFDQNTPKGTSFKSGLTTVEDVEIRTGLDFPN